MLNRPCSLGHLLAGRLGAYKYDVAVDGFKMNTMYYNFSSCNNSLFSDLQKTVGLIDCCHLQFNLLKN